MDPETTKQLIEAGKELIPTVYKDVAQPAAKVLGKQLEVVAKTVSIALTPLHVMVWGYDKIKDFIETRVSEKLRNIPSEQITTPPLTIAGPAIQGLQFAGEDEVLRELYANILATAMNSQTVNLAHPAFVEILKNISRDEALLLRAFIEPDQYPLIDVQVSEKNRPGHINAIMSFGIFHRGLGLNNENSLASYLDNLSRLGIVEIPETQHFQNEELYTPLLSDETIVNFQKTIAERGNETTKIKRRIVGLTYFGNQFVNVVVKDNE